MSFDARDLTVRLVPGHDAGKHGLFACNVCDSTPGAPRPACAPPSECRQPSAEPEKISPADLEALDLAALRSQLRETLYLF